MRWVGVKSIKPGWAEEVYDITVDDTHNFVANGVVVHNCIYQESMMRISQVVAGFDAYGRDRLRKAIGKKLPVEMAAVGEMFLEGAVSDIDTEGRPKHVFRRSTAEALWRGMEGAAAYAFNKAHSVGYAKLAYETAWLKANWPAAYGAGLLSVTDDGDRRVPILRSLAAEGITVSTPDVNLGDVQTTLGDDGVVRIGLAEIKGIQSADAQAIVAERRRNGPYRSMAELFARVRVNVSPTEADTDEDELDPDEVDVDEADQDDVGAGKAISLGSARALIEAGACDAFGPRSGLLRAMRALRVADVPIPDTEWGVVERAARERERLGASVSANPLKALTAQFQAWRSPRGDARPTPLHRVDERCATGAVVSTIGTVASLEINKKGRRRAHMTLEGSATSLPCIIWSDQLQALEQTGRLPAVGAVIGVDARVKKTVVAVPSEMGDEGGVADDDDTDDPAAQGQAPTTMTKVELIVNDVWSGELDDEPRRVLALVRVPA
ncbi:MAG: helix-hairpin-helix domain-containing protein [Acidimicrobiales bacterium]